MISMFISGFFGSRLYAMSPARLKNGIIRLSYTRY